VLFRSQIFEEFHRGPLPRGYERASDSGLGLGLSIVKRMATTLNHDLQLVSVEDKGSRFRLTLPVSISAVKVTQGTNQLPVFTDYGGLTGTKILLVENDPAGLLATKSLFDSWGCETLVARNISETMSTLSDPHWRPDILIADLHLDDGDLGTVAAKQARARLGNDLPTLIVTAAPSKTLDRELHENCMELLPKPLKPAHLRALLCHMLR